MTPTAAAGVRRDGYGAGTFLSAALAAAQVNRAPAFAIEQGGHWKRVGWDAVVGNAARLLVAFRGSELRPGGRLALLGEPSEQMVAALLAAEALGLVVAWLDLRAPRQALARAAAAFAADLAIVHLAEDGALFREMRLGKPIWVVDPLDVQPPDRRLADVLAAARDDSRCLSAPAGDEDRQLLAVWHGASSPGRFDAVTSRSLVAASLALAAHLDVRGGDRAVALLAPLSLAGIAAAVTLPAFAAVTVWLPASWFASSPFSSATESAIGRAVAEAQPTVLPATGRQWSILADRLDHELASASRARAGMVRLAGMLARRRLVLRPLLHGAGLGRLRRGFSVGPVPRRIVRWWAEAGVELAAEVDETGHAALESRLIRSVTRLESPGSVPRLVVEPAFTALRERFVGEAGAGTDSLAALPAARDLIRRELSAAGTVAADLHVLARPLGADALDGAGTPIPDVVRSVVGL